jgi:hypothetical protein
MYTEISFSVTPSLPAKYGSWNLDTDMSISELPLCEVSFPEFVQG